VQFKEFIKKLNAKTDGGYRLPTEAEWEYACRAGTSTAYSFGDKITPKDANYDDSEIGKPVVVGSYKPNAFGLYDMHGNVWEWCENWYGDYPAGAVTDPKGPAKGEYRVLRGGSFDHRCIDCSLFLPGRLHADLSELQLWVPFGEDSVITA
jgi:formylglycine-generating enzyme